MNFNDYQKMAGRTIDKNLKSSWVVLHALHGMAGEIGEIHSVYQKCYQGHERNESHLKKEVGDLLWFIAEYCTAYGWKMDDVARLNIDKLIARYPNGFEAERSINRVEGDV